MENSKNIQETYEIGGKTLTRQQLIEDFNMPLDAEVDGKNAVSLDSEEFIQRAKSIYFYSCFPIDGFSGSTYSKIYDNILKGMHPANLFNLDIVNSDSLLAAGLGPNQSVNFMKALAAHRNSTIDFSVLLDTQNITGCGGAIRKQFSRKLSGLSYDFSGLTRTVLEEIELSGLERAKTEVFLDRFANIRVVPVVDDAPVIITDSTKKFVLTGSPKEFGFKTKAEFLTEIPNWIEIGKVPDADYLITSDVNSNSSKTKAAKANNTEIITYEQAIQIYKSTNS